jgi:large subunit ribosomal protein L7/L12
MSAVQEIVEKIEKLTLLEAAELKKALEEKFGVTASAPVMMGGMMPAAAGAAGSPASEEKTEFTVALKSGGAQKINALPRGWVSRKRKTWLTARRKRSKKGCPRTRPRS